MIVFTLLLGAAPGGLILGPLAGFGFLLVGLLVPS